MASCQMLIEEADRTVYGRMSGEIESSSSGCSRV
jgi:hypothetical protein